MSGAGQVFGGVILMAVFSMFFIATARMEGWMVATVVWGLSIAITAVVAFGTLLLVGGLS